MVIEEYQTFGIQEGAELATTRSTPSSTTERVPSRMSYHTTRPDDMTSTRSSSARVTLPVSAMDCSFQNRMNDNPIIRPLRNLPAATNNAQSVAGNYSSRLSWIYQQRVFRVSEELATHSMWKSIRRSAGKCVSSRTRCYPPN